MTADKFIIGSAILMTALCSFAALAANTSGIVDDSATFDGYTIGQVVKALRSTGLLA